MSGSTVGGVAGAVVGYAVTGTMQGAQIGWMIGSYAGAVADPTKIYGPKLNDAQVQTSNEGMPRHIVFGTGVVAGNVIQTGPLVPHEHTDDGKGGGTTEQITYSYTRTYAIRICESGTVRRVWRDDKLVYDARDPATPDWGVDAAAWAADIAAHRADTAAFASKLTLYSGSETQLPDPNLEALPAAYGGGVGNVPAYRGTCYAVIANDDLTDRQGTIPQYRWEVVSEGTSATTYTDPAYGAQTNDVVLPGNDNTAYITSDSRGVRTWITTNGDLNVGESVITNRYNAALVAKTGISVENVGDGPDTDKRWFHRAAHITNSLWVKYTWSVATNNNGRCLLHRSGGFVADLRPLVGSSEAWWYGEGVWNGTPEYGGLVYFNDDEVYIGVKRAGSSGTTYNKIFKWPLADAAGEVVPATATSLEVTAGSVFFMNMDASGIVRAIAMDEEELVTYDGSLTESSRVPLTMSLSGLKAFGVDRGYLFLLISPSPAFVDASLDVYDLATQTYVDSIVVERTLSPYNHQIIFSDDSIYVKSGQYLKRLAYTPYCLTSAPVGWEPIPDSPGWLVNESGTKMPLCVTTETKVTPGSVLLSDVVSDLCGRVGLTASQLELTQLTDEVRGFVIGRQMSASDAIRALQQAYFFDYPEWDLKLRGIKRGGASLFTITDDDLVDSDDDEDTRAQAVEFPRKIHLITSDPASNYEPTKQTAERRTDNVKAVGEITVELPISATRDEAAQIVDKMLKVAWEEAAGTWKRELPEEFTELTPSDPITHGGKRYRAQRVETLDGTVKVEAVRDRISAYSSNATGSTGTTPETPVSNMRGPTRFAAMNLPQLRTQDNVAGCYVAAHGLFPAWLGAVLFMSIDGGLTWINRLTMTNAATMGQLSEPVAASTEPITVELAHGALETITSGQVSAGLNAFAVIGTDAICEVKQFQTQTEVDDDIYELTDVTHGLKGTTAAEYYGGEGFVALNESIYFLPLDLSLAGQTILFRPVTIGTLAENNDTYEFVFVPVYTAPAEVDFFITQDGQIISTLAGDYLLVA